MASELTSPNDKSPEEIQRDMQHTRDSLTEKVVALEHQVVGTVQNAATTINDTVEAVKSFVSHAPETVTESFKQATAAVSETMKDTLNISAHVRNHPWAAVGIAATLGCVVGYLSTRRQSLGAPEGYIPARAGATRSHSAVRDEEPARYSERSEPGVFGELFELIGSRVKEVARTALDSVSTAVKENIQTGVPKLVEDAASRLTDGNGRATPTYSTDFKDRARFAG